MQSIHWDDSRPIKQGLWSFTVHGTTSATSRQRGAVKDTCSHVPHLNTSCNVS